MQKECPFISRIKNASNAAYVDGCPVSDLKAENTKLKEQIAELKTIPNDYACTCAGSEMTPCNGCLMNKAVRPYKKALEEKDEKLAESEELRVKHLETIVRRENQLEELEKQLAFEYQDDDTKTITLKKALEEKDEKAKAIERGNECTRALLRDCTKILENKHREVATLKKALEEAREALEGVECAMDYAQMYLEDKLENDKDRCTEIVELPQLLKAIEARKKALTPKEEKNYKSPLHYCPHGIRITKTCVDCGRKA